MEQDKQSRGLATFTVEPTFGGIAAKGSALVEVTLCTNRLGRIQLPLGVRVRPFCLESSRRTLMCTKSEIAFLFTTIVIKGNPRTKNVVVPL